MLRYENRLFLCIFFTSATFLVQTKRHMVGTAKCMGDFRVAQLVAEMGGVMLASSVVPLLDDELKARVKEAGGIRSLCESSEYLNFLPNPAGPAGQYQIVLTPVVQHLCTNPRPSTPIPADTPHVPRTAPQEPRTAGASREQAGQRWEFIDTVKAANRAIATLQGSKILAVDLEGDLRPDGKLSLVQVRRGPGEPVYVFDLLERRDIMSKGLGNLLRSKRVVKVMHDCRKDVAALQGQFSVAVANIFDTQAAHMALTLVARRAGLNELLVRYTARRNTLKETVQHGTGVWEQRPLSDMLVDYAAQDVEYMHALHTEMRAELEGRGLLAAADALSRLNAAGGAKEELDKVLSKVLKQQEREKKAKEGKAKGGKAKGGSPEAGPSGAPGPQKHASGPQGGAPQNDNDVSVEMESSAGGGTGRVCVALGHSGAVQLSVVNRGKKKAVIHRVSVQYDREGAFTLTKRAGGALLPPGGGRARLELAFSPSVLGVHRCCVTVMLANTFVLNFRVKAVCADRLDDELLRPKEPYVGASSRKKGRGGGEEDPMGCDQVLDAPPSEAPKAAMDQPLHQSAVPTTWNEVVRAKMAAGELARLREGCEGNPAVLADLLERALWTEELQMRHDIQLFDMHGVCMKVSGARHLELQVPGLAEGRPSVLRGDSLRVTVVGGARVGYNGRVEVVTQKSVKIAFHASLYDKVRTNKDTRVNVRFSFSRLPLRVQYQGLAWARKRADLMLPVLFPSPSTLQLRSSAHSPVFTFRNANLNEEQKHAVFHMLRREVLAAPYVLWGPPGTGKTTTLVEFVYQAVLQGWRVLVVAPSNSATDNIALRLLSEKCGLDPDALLRVYSHSRNESDIPVDLKRCSNWTGKEFENPPLKEILSKRVVACTLIKAGTLYNLGVEAGHFDFVVADEASQATEADILAPLATLSGKGTRLVLGGDHKQLGAIVSSPIVQPILGLSMQERLMLRDAYQSGADGSFDPRFVTELVDNYRSHEAMLELPNRLFYDNRLLPTADYARSHSLQDWEHLPTQGFPMVFEGVDGEDERELSSPSWFNRMEALAVKEWVEKLIESDVDPKSIGIITPYAKQVQKIRMLLKAHDLGGVDVGSTEIFQGQERRVIIISTVRSTEELLDQDVKHRLGFVANPRRFNVAVTRAMALLIVIGNPRVLSGDLHWGALMHQIQEGGGYVGMSLKEQSPDVGADGENRDTFEDYAEEMGDVDEVGISNRAQQEAPNMQRDF